MPPALVEAAALLDGSADVPRLSVRTTPLSPDDVARLGLSVLSPCSPAPDALLRLAAGHEDVSSWVRHGRGLVGLGRTLELRARGSHRIEQLRAAWRQVVYASWWSDPLVRPGTGPVALGAIAFAASSQQDSVLLVPRVLVGTDDDGAWLTTAVAEGEDHPQPSAVVEELSTAATTRGVQPTHPSGAVVEPGLQPGEEVREARGEVGGVVHGQKYGSAGRGRGGWGRDDR